MPELYCIHCRKPVGAKGWRGPECQCGQDLGDSLAAAHSINGGLATVEGVPVPAALRP